MKHRELHLRHCGDRNGKETQKEGGKCTLQLTHFVVQQKPRQLRKATIVQEKFEGHCYLFIYLYVFGCTGSQLWHVGSHSLMGNLGPPALGAWDLSQQTTGEVPPAPFLKGRGRKGGETTKNSSWSPCYWFISRVYTLTSPREEIKG